MDGDIPENGKKTNFVSDLVNRFFSYVNVT